MVALSVQIETAGGLSWERWQRIVPLVERLGYRGLYLCDHFCPPGEGFADSVEITLAFAYLASRRPRLEFGSLVAPVSFRDPVFLVRQAMHLDNLSGDRMVLGVGAGWMEREHRAFGYELGDTRTRLDRLAEALEVMTLLARHEEPVSFGGRFYRLQDAESCPGQPGRPDRGSSSAAPAPGGRCRWPPATPTSGTPGRARPRRSPSPRRGWTSCSSRGAGSRRQCAAR